MTCDGTLWRSFAASLSKNATRIAIIEHDGPRGALSHTFADIGQSAAQFSTRFERSTAQTASVGILMRRSAAHVAAIIGAIQSNRLFYSINPSVSATQIGHMVKVAGSELIVCDAANLIKLEGLIGSEPRRLKVLFVAESPLNPIQQKAFSNLSGHFDVISLGDGENRTTRSARTTAKADDPLQVLFTSGSTGVPKAVLLRNGDLVERARSEISAYEIVPDDRLLNVLPFSFDVGCNQLYSALLSGCTLVLLNSWLPRDIMTSLKLHAITGISGVPSIWKSLLGGDGQALREACESLRYLTISGGSLSAVEQKNLRQHLDHTAIYKTYGQTETFRSAMLMPDEFKHKHATVGRPPPGVMTAIMKPDGSRAGPGETGEILHAGTGTMIGYLGDARSSAKVLRAGPHWFKTGGAPVIYTGDRGTIDRDGYLTVLGRMDRMLKIRGNRVYPEEIEAKLLDHPDVLDAVAVQGADPDRLKAILNVTRPGALNAFKLMQFLAKRLPSYMIPQDFEFVDDIPKTASGKVAHAALQAGHANAKPQLLAHEA